MLKFAMEKRNSLSQIADHRQVARAYAVQLRRIDFEVNNAGVRSKTTGLAGDAVVQPGPEYQQQIRLVQCRVSCPCAMHANHAEVVRLCGTYGTEAVHRCEGRNLQVV